MTLDKFLEKRKEKTFTAEDIRDILTPLGYRCEWLDTQISTGTTWKESGMREAAARRLIFEETKQESKRIPFHFAYIKFYEKDGRQFALVAGKTKANHAINSLNMQKDDKIFYLQNKAKKNAAS